MPWTPRYSESEVREAVGTSRSYSEALRCLGLRPAGGNHGSLKKLIAHYRISTDHFDPYWGSRVKRGSGAKPLAEILVESSTYNRGRLKERLYDSGLKTRQCELCGQGEDWHDHRMSLILDHINGVPTDNRIENLQIVCPNCAATLETHCGRKNKLEQEYRSCLRCAKEFVVKYSSHRYCSLDCGVRHPRRDHGPRPETRKVPRPPYEQLLEDLKTMSYCAVGRKYGVSDNAIRKWLRWYEYGRQKEDEADSQTSSDDPPDTIAA